MAERTHYIIERNTNHHSGNEKWKKWDDTPAMKRARFVHCNACRAAGQQRQNGWGVAAAQRWWDDLGYRNKEEGLNTQTTLVL